jgi:hypothetical protein
MLFPHSGLVAVFCTSDISRITKGNYRFYFIEFTQQHPTPPREVMTDLVITSLFLYLPNLLVRSARTPKVA